MALDVASQLESCMLLLLSSTDTTSLKSAEESLKSFLTTRDAPGALIQVLEKSGHATARQMAGIFLRKRLVALWNQLKPNDRVVLQQMLLTRLALEPQRPVRKALISCVSSLGKLLLPGNNWPEVITLLNHAVRDQSEDVRELAMLLILELTEGMGERSAEFASNAFSQMVLSGLLDTAPSGKVRRSALRSACCLLSTLRDDHNEQQRMSPLLEPLLVVTGQCVGLNGLSPVVLGSSSSSSTTGATSGAGALPEPNQYYDEDAACVAFECLGDLIEAGSPAVTPFLDRIVLAMVGVLDPSKRNLVEMSTRGAAAEVLHVVIDNRPRYLYRKRLLHDVLIPLSFSLLAEYDPIIELEAFIESREAGVEVSDYSNPFGWAIGGRLLDAIALSLPEKTIFPAIWTLSQSWSQSTDWHHRHAAVCALGVISEGCSGILQEEQVLPAVLDLVLTAAKDPEEAVRLGVCHALALFSEWLLPRISRFHYRILPTIVNMMVESSSNSSSSEAIIEKGSGALECFCDGMDTATISPYLQQLMGFVGALLSRSNGSPSTQECLLGATGSIAVAAGAAFTPFAPAVCTTLVQMMRLSDERLVRLRGKATEAFGQIAVACGPSVVGPFFLGALSCAEESLQMDSELELIEDTFHFLSSMAEVFGATPEFEAQLEPLVEKLIDTARSLDGTEAISAGGFSEDKDGLAQRVEDFERANTVGAWGLERTKGAVNADDIDEDNEDEDDDDVSGDSQENDEDDGDYYQRDVKIRVRTSFVEVQSAAVRCLGHCVGFCRPAAVGPVLERVCSVIFDMLHHYHKETRVQAVHALIHVVKAYALQFPLFVNGVMGMNVSSTGPLNTIETMQRLLSLPSHGGATMPPRSPPAPTALHPNMIETYGQMMVEVLGVIRDDPDEAVAANGCATLAEWCSNLGSAAVSNHADAIMKALLLVLKRKTASQRIANDEEEEEAGEDTTRAATALDEADENDDVANAFRDQDNDDEDKDDENNVDHSDLLDEATDAIVAVARVLTPSVFSSRYLQDVMRELMKLSAHGKPTMDVLMAIGCMGDLAEALGLNGFSNSIPTAIPRVLMWIAEPSCNRTVRRNCTFDIGIFIERCPLACQPFIGRLLTSLQPLVQRTLTGSSTSESGNKTIGAPFESDALTDNAAAALCRALTTFPEVVVPLHAVLEALLSILPLRADYTESGCVYGTLLWLLHSRRAREAYGPTVLPRLLTLFASVIDKGRNTPRIVSSTVGGIKEEGPGEAAEAVFLGLKELFRGLSISGVERESEKQAVYSALELIDVTHRSILESILKN
jgi:importin-4